MSFSKVVKFLTYYWIAFASLIFILLISVLFFYRIQTWAKERQKIRFELRTTLAQNAIERRINYYINVLKAGRGLFLTSYDVTRSEWKTFIQSLEVQNDYPGIQGIGFSVWIEPQNLEQHIKTIRLDGFPDYNIHPSGNRNEYTSIIYLEPLDWRNRRAIGYDMFTEPRRRRAMERARDSNKVAISEKIVLVQETHEDIQFGFNIYLPIYKKGAVLNTIRERRNNLIGFVYSPFRVNDLIKRVLQNQYKDIGIEIYDGDKFLRDALLYNSDSTFDYYSLSEKEKLQRISKLYIAGHTWTILYTVTPEFNETSDLQLAYAVLGGGVIIAFLVFIIMFFIATSQATLKKINTELADKNQQLIKINNDLDNFIYTASHDLKAPISNIEGLLSVLRELVENENENREDERQVLTMMSASIDRFKNTILDLTEITKVQKNIQEDVVKIYFQDVYNEIRDTLYPLLNESGTKIITDFKEQDSLKFSRKNMRSIIFNLLNNAIKYHSPLRKPEIYIRTEKVPDYVVLCVKDNGLGIPKEKQRQMFEMFKRMHDHVEGTGIGLYIVKRIVDNSGGKIEVESELDKGTTFRVYFRSND